MRPLRSALTGFAIAALLALASLHAQTSPPPRLTPDDLFDHEHGAGHPVDREHPATGRR